jgi:hypothetical protein
MSKKKAAKRAAPKKQQKKAAQQQKAAPKKITIRGFEGKVNLRKGILKPISQQARSTFASIRPGETQNKGKEALKATKQLIKKLAADGKLGKKDLKKINEFTAQNRLGKHFEPRSLSNAVSSSLTAAQYRDFTRGQKQELKGFRKEQTSIVNRAMQQQVSQLQSMIGSMQQNASNALRGFSSALSSSMAASSKMLNQQQRAFAAQNRRSEANIRKAQSRIVGLPKAPKKTKQISKTFDKVSAGDMFSRLQTPTQVNAGDRFARIGQRQAPIQVRSSPALTGFSTQQRESQARQIQGLSGFRSSRA